MSASATAAPAAIPESTRAEPEARGSASCCARKSKRPARPGRSSASACATRGASPSTARTATSGSATSARTVGGDRLPAARELDKLANYGWSRYEGKPSTTRASRTTRKAAPRSSARSCTRTPRAARSRAATSIAATPSRRRAATTSTATTAPARSGASASASTAAPSAASGVGQRRRRSRRSARTERRAVRNLAGRHAVQAPLGVRAILRTGQGERITSRLALSLALILVASVASLPAEAAAARPAASPVPARPSRPRATTGRASAGTHAAATTIRMRPGSRRRTWARSIASRSTCRHGRLLARSTCTACRSTGRPTTRSSSRPPTGSRSRSTPRAGRSSGAGHRPATRAGRLGADHDGDARRRSRAASGSTPRRLTGGSRSCRSRPAMPSGAARSRSCRSARRSPPRSTSRAAT